MRRIFLSLLVFFTIFNGVFAQVLDPIQWTFEAKRIDNNKVEIICTATLEEGWHVYASSLPENTAIPTSIVIEANESFTVIDGISEKPEAEVHFDEQFNAELRWFKNKAQFIKTIEVKSNEAFVVKGYVESMICNDETCMPPQEVEFSVPVEPTPIQSQSESYWGIFFLAFLGGLAALLTPCVFPMIPMTVSFFTKQSANRAIGIRNALTYGVSIILIYLVLGIGISAIFGADTLNAMSTNPWFNLFFFVLLVVFAISFFGAFEIVMPSSWVNFADKNSDRGGLIGIFFMAFTLALVSFSCTGPIVGSLLVQAATGGYMGPIVGMFGFSLALALPFGVFAAFPGYLNSLPKSGGWLNSVKVVLGFLELAFAFKFLSNTDMVLGLHFLERELFLAIWIVIFGALGFYLLGKIRLPHDSKMEYLPVSRLLLGLSVLAFTVYMIPGLWGAPVKLISAFPPGTDYAEMTYDTSFSSSSSGTSANVVAEEKGLHLGPQGIPVFKDYDLALAHAKEVNKPLLVDFTGLACVNCRKMENNVWSVPEIKNMLSNKFIVVSLYVDSREDLAESYVSEATGKKIRTVGQKWADFQFSKYKLQGQPYYILEDENQNQLAAPRAYDTNVDAYKEWLQNALTKFEASSKLSSL